MFLSSKWRIPKLLIGLFAIEFCGIVAALALFGISSPDTFRSNLWKDGSANGFNSDPKDVLYAYANYRPIPKTPLIWSQFITNFNVVMAVLTMFILLVKTVMNMMHLWHPLLSLIIHTGISGLWAFSTYGQAGPDMSNPKYPSKSPWYLRKSCSVVSDKSNFHGCQMYQGAFAVTVIMLALFIIHIPYSIWSLIPTKEQKLKRMSKEMNANSPDSDDGNWMMQSVPPTPAPPKTPGGNNPMTPRTMAFNTLSRQFPTRAQKQQDRSVVI